MPVRTRITLELVLPTSKEAHEFTDRLRAGEVNAMWGKTFEVTGVVNIVEPDLEEK